MASRHEYNPDNIFGYGPPSKSGKIPFNPPGTDKHVETAYWLWGDLSSNPNPPLIIVHGGPGAPGREWQAMALLNDKYNIPVIIYDEVGCGESTRLPETKGDTTFWGEHLFVAELKNLIDHFQLKKYSLLGHSCGAMITVPFALTQPQGLHKMIIASSSAKESLRAHGFRKSLAPLPQETQDIVLHALETGDSSAPEYEAANQKWMKIAFCRMDPWPKEMNDCISYMDEDDTVSSTLFGGKPLTPTGPASKYDVIDRLPEITERTAPGGVLLTNGHWDVSSDAGLMPFFTQIRAKVKWVRFAESGHFSHIEEHAAYLKTLGEFLTLH